MSPKERQEEEEYCRVLWGAVFVRSVDLGMLSELQQFLGSECDSPFRLTNLTLDFIEKKVGFLGSMTDETLTAQ
jgi:hypothetical protein